MKDPTCPICANTIFVYQGVASSQTLSRALKETGFDEKNSISDHLKIIANKENRSDSRKTPIVHNLLKSVQEGQSEVLVVYCPKCGTIIGTSCKYSGR